MLKTFTTDTRSAAGGVLAIALLSLAVGAPAHAQGAGAVVPLPAQMATAAEEYLPGVVGEPVPAFTIDPALASLAAGTRTYEIVSGRDAGRTEQHVVAALPRDPTGTRWRYTIGAGEFVLAMNSAAVARPAGRPLPHVKS